ncbi:DUF3048 domain-containing protein [Patescibacteria group bacterium]|nr:DUF3048 domain-containing protein [Patescibacteria group bacterium]
MNFKELLQRLRQKAKFEPKFIGVLALVAVGAFVIISLILGAIMHSVEKSRYEIQPLDERIVYDAAPHDVKNDFSLLLEKQPSVLNGAPIEQDIGKGQALAVIIENYTPIRSTQVGLEDAAIVYEVPTEGGITRLLAIYDGQPVEVMGPVRSARPYFITWASEYRAALVHVGGSPDSLANLRGNFRLFNIDEFADYVTIWRNNQYLAPHNAFTSTENIYKRLNKEEYYQPVKTKRFPFKNPDSESGDIRTITIDFSIAPYAVKYDYDEATHTYTRSNGGKPHHNIKPANVVVQFVDTQVLDDIGRLRIQTHGTGNAVVFRDGHVIEGTWEKDASINSPDQPMDQSWTKFFDKNGNEITLNRGQVWIEVVPNERPVNYF